MTSVKIKIATVEFSLPKKEKKRAGDLRTKRKRKNPAEAAVGVKKKS